MAIQEKIDEKIYCKACEQKTNHGYLIKHSVDGDDEEFQFEEHFYIIQCLGCDTIAFLREYGDETMLDYDEDGDWVYYTEKSVYPEEPAKLSEYKEIRREIKEFEKVPSLINDLYNQVVSSYNSRHYLLCAVGLRMIVEGVCKELDVKEGFTLNEHGEKVRDKQGNETTRANLEGKINGLQTAGVITNKQSEILHQIRLFGNITAHELKVPRRTAVKSGLEIIENVLHNIFDLEKYSLV
ncbi:DUF4145 domain-containing protein [Viridibacillus sp. YIM B01967]|uniref:DUF4145 domain-containing protein n=1 Tax=Viridibacillus soli TaxID=2798301 RepID=A0ABS1H7Q5_9BACL|nr:DUF4145 domain-containing protein [Viridibacillus soli]MBK3495329.1 DUF4145 domain-containing protein [Viridibacillus soli]